MHFLIGVAVFCLIILMIAANPKAFGWALVCIVLTCGGCLGYVQWWSTNTPEGRQAMAKDTFIPDPASAAGSRLPPPTVNELRQWREAAVRAGDKADVATIDAELARRAHER